MSSLAETLKALKDNRPVETEPYEKDGRRFIPFDHFIECGRCDAKIQLTASHPIGESDAAAWNDGDWVWLSQFVPKDNPTPPKFFVAVEASTNRGEPFFPGHRRCTVGLCPRCAGQFNSWLARSD